MTRCFFLEPTDRYARSLRRFTFGRCPADGRGHDASTGTLDVLTAAQVAALPGSRIHEGRPSSGDHWPHDDAAWPALCAACGRQFRAEDEWQVNYRQLYRRADTGAEMTLGDAPPGAMWDAAWLTRGVDFSDPDGDAARGRYWPFWPGPDGRCLAVRLPDGHTWNVDSRCSNCTLPHDNRHRCWVRHGEPPDVTVDKNGLTCQAGAGSIMSPRGWHGFLRGGELVL